MKKTLVALAVAAAAVAGSANAAVVYENDGSKVELSGSFRTFLGKDETVGSRGDLRDDGSRVEIKGNQDLGNGLSAFLGYEIRFKNDNAIKNQDGSASNWGAPTNRQLYAGFKHADVGALSFGRQLTTADDVVQDAAYYRSGSYNPLTTLSDKSIKFKSADFGGFQIGADYLFGHAKTEGTNAVKGLEYKNGYGVTAFYHYDIAENHGLEFAAGYTQDNYDDQFVTNDTKLRSRAWVLHGSYTYGPVYFALNYGQMRDALNEDLANYGDNTKGRYAMADFRYQYSQPSAVFAQWERKDLRIDGQDVTEEIKNRYQVGVDYRLHKNVLTYVMYEQERTKDSLGDTTKDNIYGVGLRVFF